jgi:thymidine phosphorylase
MAEGIDALVLDAKFGDGAFMKSFADARALAQAMLDIGRGMGKRVAALLTDMQQPLGRTVGNALETQEAIETLKGRGPTDLESLSLELAAWMLRLAGIAPALEEARRRVREALASGAGLRRFQQVIERQGGDPRVCDDPGLLPQARERVDVRARAEGRVASIGCRATGHAAMLLGAGRETVDSRVDPAVGIVFHKKVGDRVMAGEPVCTLHVNDRSRLEQAQQMLAEAIRVAPEAPAAGPLVREVIE